MYPCVVLDSTSGSIEIPGRHLTSAIMITLLERLMTSYSVFARVHECERYSVTRMEQNENCHDGY